jgi:hypothetical protein
METLNFKCLVFCKLMHPEGNSLLGYPEISTWACNLELGDFVHGYSPPKSVLADLSIILTNSFRNVNKYTDQPPQVGNRNLL